MIPHSLSFSLKSPWLSLHDIRDQTAAWMAELSHRVDKSPKKWPQPGQGEQRLWNLMWTGVVVMHTYAEW